MSSINKGEMIDQAVGRIDIRYVEEAIGEPAAAGYQNGRQKSAAFKTSLILAAAVLIVSLIAGGIFVLHRIREVQEESRSSEALNDWSDRFPCESGKYYIVLDAVGKSAEKTILQNLNPSGWTQEYAEDLAAFDVEQATRTALAVSGLTDPKVVQQAFLRTEDGRITMMIYLTGSEGETPLLLNVLDKSGLELGN